VPFFKKEYEAYNAGNWIIIEMTNKKMESDNNGVYQKSRVKLIVTKVRTFTSLDFCNYYTK